MRVLLIDDHDLFRDGLKWLLSGLDSNLQFVEADSLAAFSGIVTQGDDAFDVVLLDLCLPDSDGLEGLRLVRDILPGAVTVVLSGSDDPQFIAAAIEGGAAGYIPKSSTQEVLIAALRLVLAGGVYIPPHVLRSTFTAPENHPDANVDTPSVQPQTTVLAHLTARQRDVLKLAVHGKVNKIIARELKISEATVKAHLSASFRVLGVTNRTEATFKAADMGLFHQAY